MGIASSRLSFAGDSHKRDKSTANLEKLAQTSGEANPNRMLRPVYCRSSEASLGQQNFLENGQTAWHTKNNQGFPTSGAMLASLAALASCNLSPQTH